MRILDLSLPTIAENLALDEWLLRQVEDGGPEVLRFWVQPTPVIVLGSSGVIAEEVAEQATLPLARRPSGGGTVVVGPGCLVVSLALSLERRPALRDIKASYVEIGGRIATAIGCDVVEGDLVRDGRKVSGSAQRRLQRAMLHHATLLDAMDLSLLSQLREPVRRPDYRRDRVHADFVANLELGTDALRARIAVQWRAEGEIDGEPALDALVARYADEAWIRRR